MKITYQGKHTLVLPLRGRRPLVLGRDQVGSIEELDWERLSGRPDIKALQRQGQLVVSGARPELITPPDPLPEQPVKLETAEPSVEDAMDAFQNLSWKKAVQLSSKLEPLEFIEKLLVKETRPSVKSALEARKEALEMAELEAEELKG